MNNGLSESVNTVHHGGDSYTVNIHRVLFYWLSADTSAHYNDDNEDDDRNRAVCIVPYVEV